MKIFFKSEKHKQRFLAAIQNIGKIYDSDKIDCYYGSALYILSADQRTLENARGYISNHGIDFDGLLKNVDFGGAYSVLIQFACSLFNGNVDVDFEEFMRLDGNNFNLAVVALQFRYYGAIHAVCLRDLEVQQ